MIKTAQPYGGFANTMLAKQNYPDLRVFPGGPPEPPYDVTGHTLWMLTGVTVDAVAKPFEAPLELVKKVAPMTATVAARPKGAYLIGPESYGTSRSVARAAEGERAGLSRRQGASTRAHEVRPGTWVIPVDGRVADNRREVRQGARHRGGAASMRRRRSTANA